VTLHLEVDEAMVPHLALAIAYYRRDVLPRDGMPTPPELVAVQEFATKASRGLARPGAATVDDATLVPDAQLVPLLLRQDEVAEVLRVSARTVRRLAAAGKLRAVTVEGAVRYRPADVEEYAAGLAPRTMRERISTKTAVGAAGRAVARGVAAPGPGAEHRKGAA
jgi:excisionase family DNA binding protein